MSYLRAAFSKDVGCLESIKGDTLNFPLSIIHFLFLLFAFTALVLLAIHEERGMKEEEQYKLFLCETQIKSESTFILSFRISFSSINLVSLLKQLAQLISLSFPKIVTGCSGQCCHECSKLCQRSSGSDRGYCGSAWG